MCISKILHYIEIHQIPEEDIEIHQSCEDEITWGCRQIISLMNQLKKAKEIEDQEKISGITECLLLILNSTFLKDIFINNQNQPITNECIDYLRSEISS